MFIPGHFYRVSLWLSHPTEESCVAERLNSFATRTGCLPGSADPDYITLVMGVISQVIRCRTKLKLTPIASTAPPVVTSARRKTFDLGPGTSRSVGDKGSPMVGIPTGQVPWMVNTKTKKNRPIETKDQFQSMLS